MSLRDDTTVPSFEGTVTPDSDAALYVQDRFKAGWKVGRIRAHVATSGNKLHYRQAMAIVNDTRSVCEKCGEEFYGRVKHPKYCHLECRPGNRSVRKHPT